jgi:hypothetical protein
MEVVSMLFDQIGSQNYKIAASKLEVLRIQLEDEVGIKFQRLYPCSRVQQLNGSSLKALLSFIIDV